MSKKIEIRMSSSRTGEVWVDGEKLDDVVAVTFEVDVRKGTEMPASVQVVQRFFPSEVLIDGEEVDVTTLTNAAQGRQFRTHDA